PSAARQPPRAWRGLGLARGQAARFCLHTKNTPTLFELAAGPASRIPAAVDRGPRIGHRSWPVFEPAPRAGCLLAGMAIKLFDGSLRAQIRDAALMTHKGAPLLCEKRRDSLQSDT